MKKALLIVAMLLLVTPVMAATTITAVQEGAQFLADGVKQQTVRIEYSGDVNVRAFALDINIDAGPTFDSIRDYNVGEANGAVTGGKSGYGIFPSRFRDFIVVTGPNWVNPQYNPLAAWNEPGTTNTGIGYPKMIAEMGTLYAGEANRPSRSGTLFRFDVNSENSVGTFNLAIAANTLRGGVVDGDGNTITPTFVGTSITFAPVGCTVPNVVNVLEATAISNITGAGFPAPSKSGQQYSGTIAAGNIISTNPAAGGPISCSTVITYVLSLGPCTVPNVVGLFEAPIMTAGPNAVGQLTAAGFTTARATTTSATVAAGKIISTAPASGATPGCGTIVTMTVSTGKGTCATCKGDMVPNSVLEVADMSSLKASLLAGFARTGLYKADKGSAVTGDKWNICGDLVADNALQVSDMSSLKAKLLAGFTAGGLYKAPFVPTNNPVKTQAAMTTAITNSFLVVGSVTTAHHATIPSGSVISTNPAYPAYRNCNLTVDMVVSVGP